MIVKGEEILFRGEWAELKKNYLIGEKPEDYDELASEDMLLEYLSATEDRYSKRFDELVERQMEIDGVNEELKVTN